jgi:hypothetical protein
MRTLRFLVCALAVLAFAACSSSSAKKDVTISQCKADAQGGHPTVSGQIHNHSSKASSYAIHVKFDDKSGNGVGDGVAAVGRVDSGATAQWHATGTENAKGPVKCSLASVTRTIAP